MVTPPLNLPNLKKVTPINRYDIVKKGPADYADVAYKEAVSRLRYMLNETYGPSTRPYSTHGNDSDDDLPNLPKLATFPKPSFKSFTTDLQQLPSSSPHELLSFIERQEDYIEQLEKESQYCRDELSQLLIKVKDLINENEALHDQQKTTGLKKVLEGIDESCSEAGSDIKCRGQSEGPSIVFESRIAELEAQLSQTKRDLKKAMEESELYRKKLLENDPTSATSDFYRQIETLHKEKRELSEALSKLQMQIGQMRDRESDASKKVQRTLSAADKAQMDRQQAEMEVQRLKTELEQQHDRLLEVLSEQTRKVAEERNQAERRYLQHVESLSAELTMQRDSATKLQLELERHLRIEEDLRRDLTAKTATLETVRKEFNTKIAGLQSELSEALSERDFIQQELNSCRMSNERAERAAKQDVSRLQIEVNALRQRIDRSDSELMHARRENLRLAEQLSALDKEISLYKIRIGEMDNANLSPEPDGKKESSSPKQVDRTISELETLVEKQAQTMQYLSQQCHSLTQKLEEATALHKEEMGNLQSNLEYLSSRLESSIMSRPWQGYDSEYHHQQPQETSDPNQDQQNLTSDQQSHGYPYYQDYPATDILNQDNFEEKKSSEFGYPQNLEQDGNVYYQDQREPEEVTYPQRNQWEDATAEDQKRILEESPKYLPPKRESEEEKYIQREESDEVAYPQKKELEEPMYQQKKSIEEPVVPQRETTAPPQKKDLDPPRGTLRREGSVSNRPQKLSPTKAQQKFK